MESGKKLNIQTYKFIDELWNIRCPVCVELVIFVWYKTFVLLDE